MARTLFKDYGNRQTQRPQDDVKQTMREVTQEYLEDMELDSVFFRRNAARSIAALSPSEVEVNKRIGMGEFGIVLEVTDIRLHDDGFPTNGNAIDDGPCRTSPEHGHPQAKPKHHFHAKSCGALPLQIWDVEESKVETMMNQDDDVSPENEQLRQRLARTVFRQCNVTDVVPGRSQPRPSESSSSSNSTPRSFLRPRFAVKQIRKDLYPKRKIEAGKDLAREAKLLSRLEHPNIIRLRAIVGRPGEDDFMLLLDRLETSLSEQVMQWHQRLGTASTGLLFPWSMSISNQRKDLERNVLSERLLALYDVARAMHYLHQKSILFRDLKTENVARNHHGAFQLLDFGLAKELKEKDRASRIVADPTASDDESLLVAADDSMCHPSIHSDDCDDMYKLTGLTGTIRVMSPEILQCQPYGLSADVYGYGIMMWEVFQGERNRLSAAEIIKGQRPDLPVAGMPPRIESLIKKCYGNPSFRPTFAMLSQELEYQLLELQQEAWNARGEMSRNVHDKSGEVATTFQPISLDHVQFFQRFDYLRQLSIQSLATVNSTASAMAVVEN